MKWALIAVWMFAPDTSMTARGEFDDLETCTVVARLWTEEAAKRGLKMHTICLPDRSAK